MTVHTRATPRTWVRSHPATTFVVLAFALSWWPWTLTALNPDSTPMVPLGPAVAAVVVVVVVGGRAGFAQLGRSIVLWRVHWSWYAFALGLPFVLTGLAAAAGIALGVPASGTGTLAEWSTWTGVPLLLLTTGLFGGPLFEEIGWRGFLLPQLQRRRTVLWSTAVVGGVWVLWHLPLLVSEPTGQRPPLAFSVWVLALAVLLTLVFNGTDGSVLLAVLFHTAANTAGRLLLEPFSGRSGFEVIWWLMTGLYCAAGIAFWWTRGDLGAQRRVSVERTAVG